MKITALVDNLACGECAGEWGLSLWIEYRGKKILLDFGSSELFAANAGLMGISLADADFAVLSHAHYDHSDGMEAFFAANSAAPLYVAGTCAENCWKTGDPAPEYIGIRRGLLDKYSGRIIHVGKCSPASGVTLLPHTAPGREEAGIRAGMFITTPDGDRPDSFDHEQTLIFETEKGLVVFNSCSHAGVLTVIDEAEAAFPGKKVYMYVGGLHLFRSSEDYIRALASDLADRGVERLLTGHCTGEAAIGILREAMGERLEVLCSGLVTEV